MTEKILKWLTIDRLILIIGWAMTIGGGLVKFDQLQDSMKEMQQQMFEQQQLNGKVIMYIELDSKSEQP